MNFQNIKRFLINNIVIKTDTHLNITYVNELFCQISGFQKRWINW